MIVFFTCKVFTCKDSSHVLDPVAISNSANFKFLRFKILISANFFFQKGAQYLEQFKCTAFLQLLEDGLEVPEAALRLLHVLLKGLPVEQLARVSKVVLEGEELLQQLLGLGPQGFGLRVQHTSPCRTAALCQCRQASRLLGIQHCKHLGIQLCKRLGIQHCKVYSEGV